MFPLAQARGGYRNFGRYLGGLSGLYPYAPATEGSMPLAARRRRFGGTPTLGNQLGNQLGGRPPREDPLAGLPIWRGGPRNKWGDLGLRSLLGLTQGLFIPQLQFARELLPEQQGAIRSLLMALSSRGEEAGLRNLQRSVAENVGEFGRMLGSVSGIAPEVALGMQSALASAGAERVLQEAARLGSPEYQRERELARVQAAGLPIEGLGSILQLMSTLYPLMQQQKKKKGGLGGILGNLLGTMAGQLDWNKIFRIGAAAAGGGV